MTTTILRPTEILIYGQVFGTLWMGGRAWKEIKFQAEVDGRSLREIVEEALRKTGGGDFRDSPQLSELSHIEFRRIVKLPTWPWPIAHSRAYSACHFPSLEGLLTSEWDDPWYED